MTTSKRARREGTSADTASIAGYVADELLGRARELGAAGGGPRWPAAEYQKDPARFCREVLGIALTPEQREIIEGIRDHRRVAVSGGRKVGKDFVVAAAALWFYCSFPRARVQFTAVTERQVQRVFWRQVCEHVRGAGRCVDCKRDDPAGPKPCKHSRLITEEVPPELARTGLKDAETSRELVGYTAQEAGGIRGISGDAMLDIIDEASDVDDGIIAALDGNKAGSAHGRTVLLSNPTRTVGQFYRAFHNEQHLWKTFSLSSLEIAKKYGGKIPGVAREEEIRELIEKYGAESDFVQIHVHGRFVENEQGRAFTVAAILAAVARWAETEPTGPLYLGIDVAGESGAGDESAFAPRRGAKLFPIETFRGLTAEDHVAHALRVCRAYPSPDPTQKPTIVIDRGGEAGSKVWGTFIAYRQTVWQDPPFKLVGLDASRKAMRKPDGFDRVRDELVANMADWMRQGGAIPNDPMLQAELNEFRWLEQPIANRNRLVDKRKMREQLNRSPDRADGLALSCWVETHWKAPSAGEAPPPASPQPTDMQDANRVWFEEPAAQGAQADGDPWWPKG